jgi:hypothetical protein
MGSFGLGKRSNATGERRAGPLGEESPDWLADRLHGGAAENCLSGGIKQYDALVFGHHHNRVHGRLDDARQAAFAITHCRFHSLPVGDVDEYRARGFNLSMRASDWLDGEFDPEGSAICVKAVELLTAGFLPGEKPLENLMGLLFAVNRIGVEIEDQPTRQSANAVSE